VALLSRNVRRGGLAESRRRGRVVNRATTLMAPWRPAGGKPSGPCLAHLPRLDRRAPPPKGVGFLVGRISAAELRLLVKGVFHGCFAAIFYRNPPPFSPLISVRGNRGNLRYAHHPISSLIDSQVAVTRLVGFLASSTAAVPTISVCITR
jgi:hypothetical protein